VGELTETAEAEPRLKPADLQVRLRAGDTPEQLANETGLTAEFIRRFERPILAERDDAISHVQRFVVGTEDLKRKVGDLVVQRLTARGIDPEQLTWQARKAGNAPWSVELRYDDGARVHSVRWTYDETTKQLVALDDEARWLSAPEEPTTSTSSISVIRPRPVPTPSADSGSELPQASGAHTPITGLRRTRPAPYRTPNPSQGEADEIARIVPIHRWQAEKIETSAIPLAQLPGMTRNHPAGKAQGESDKKGGRSKVPSWDEIVFGAKPEKP
jgi:hypothetical protein